MITLDIFSDPICPWCYIGWVNLKRAMGEDSPFKPRWRVFQLNPDMPARGMDRQTYLTGKFGGKDGALRAYTPISERAAADDIPLNLHLTQRTPSTENAHRVLLWADIEGKQTAVADALFNAYFVNGEDIGDENILVAIAERVGLDADMIARLLHSDSDFETIRAEDASARAMGLTGVPAFILNQYHVIGGAQTEAFWRNLIAEINSDAV